MKWEPQVPLIALAKAPQNGAVPGRALDMNRLVGGVIYARYLQDVKERSEIDLEKGNGAKVNRGIEKGWKNLATTFLDQKTRILEIFEMLTRFEAHRRMTGGQPWRFEEDASRRAGELLREWGVTDVGAFRLMEKIIAERCLMSTIFAEGGNIRKTIDESIALYGAVIFTYRIGQAIAKMSDWECNNCIETELKAVKAELAHVNCAELQPPDVFAMFLSGELKLPRGKEG
ncbi:Uncharacterised protein [Candidatus Burarchaeum australiense]|nr:Uncharacterised protein [Candidatus Burarchaeum australiense]